MRELFRRETVLNFLMLPVFAIGGFYDRRIAIGEFNFTYLFSAAFIISFLFILKRRGFKKLNRHLLLMFFLIYIITLINWLFWGINSVDNYSINKLITLLLITFPICFYVSKFRSEKEVVIFFKQISLVGLLLGVLGFAQILSGGGGETRLAVFGGGPIVFSRWVGLFCIVFLYNFDVNRIFKFFVVLICVVLMLFSGSKGPFLFLLLTLFILHIKSKKILTFLFSGITIIHVYSESLVRQLTGYPILIRIFGLDESSSITEGTSSSARVSLLSESVASILDNPFGHGLGNFSIYSDKLGILGPTGYPHNFFIEIWLESGIILIVMTFVYCIFVVIDIFNNLYRNTNTLTPAKRTIIALWIFYFLNSMVSGDLSDARFLIVFTALYYVLILINRKSHL